MQETFFLINNQKPKTGKLDYLKFAIWIPWLLSIIILVLLAGGYKNVEYFFHLEHGISVNNIYMFIPYYSVIVLFFVISVSFGKRANCHYICWMSPFMIVGRKMSNLLSLPALRLQADRTKCVGCHVCDKGCPMSLDVSTMVKADCMENAECILCGKCVDNCSKHAIRYYFGEPIKRKV
jgi:polyferredoxin